MTIIDFVKTMMEFRKISNHVYPEQWNFICQMHEIPVPEAQDMYYDFKNAMNGHLPYNRREGRVDEERLAKIFSLANEVYSFSNMIPKDYDLNLVGFDEYGQSVKVFWKNESGEVFSAEGDIRFTEIYMKVTHLIQSGMTIIAIVPEVDRISSLENYVGEDKPQYLVNY